MARETQKMAIDVEARTIATKAQSKIESHEDECARRYGEVASAISEIKGEFVNVRAEIEKGRSQQTMWTYAVVGLLITISGFLIVNGRPWSPASHNTISIQENMK